MKKKHKTSVINKFIHKAGSKTQSARRPATKRRALHKRVALHPINFLFLMCAGILLVSATYNAFAVTYSVNATVPAPPLTQPAVIASPTDGMVTSVQALSVSGTCPTQSYVKLTDNGQYVGTSTCDGTNAFQVGLNLTAGQNVLNAQDYNITDSPGPAGTPITVTYYPPASPTPPPPITNPGPTAPATPASLRILHDDNSVPYANGTATPIVSEHPTFSGIAPPYSIITVTVHSNAFTCAITANAQGYWQCTMAASIPDGLHEVDVTARTPDGQALTFPQFKIQVVGVTSASPYPSTKYQLSLDSNASSKLLTFFVGQKVTINMAATGGVPPSAVTVEWGDGTSSTYLTKDATAFPISHTYKWFNGSSKNVTIKVQAVDANGHTSTLQLAGVLRNPNYIAVIGSSSGNGRISKVLADLHPWLWVFWPGYIIVLLLVFSFWLGERQEQFELMKVSKRRKKLHHAHHAK